MKGKIMLVCIGLLMRITSVDAATNYCNHVLFPIQPDAEWTYTGTRLDSEKEGYTLSVQSVFTRGSTSTAKMNLISHSLNDVTYPLLFECNQTDGIKLIELNNVIIPLPNGTVVNLTLNEQIGSLIPPMDQIQSRTPWQFILDFKGSYTSEKGKSIAVRVRAEVNSQLSEILPSMDVPAGTFENVFVIQQDVSFQLTLSKMKKPIRTLNSVRTWYLAEGIGPISAEFLGALSELMYYSLPECGTIQ